MKKAIFKLTAILMIAIAIVSCSPEDGKNGSDGSNGTNGINGTNGTNGANTILNSGFNVGAGFGGGTGNGQFFNSGVNTKVNFPNVITDVQNAFSVTNNELTIISSGFYHFTATVTLNTSLPVDTPIILQLRQNSSNIKYIRERFTNFPSISITANVLLNAGDKITVYFVQNSVSTQFLTNDSLNTNFSGYRVY